MCHLDALAFLERICLFLPFNKMWQKVGKVIDRLYLQNHKDPKCKIMYNPDSSLSKRVNTMAAEQVNVWASRLKRIMASMPYIHHMFFFHRMVKKKCIYRNLLQNWEATCMYFAKKNNTSLIIYNYFN
jgi:hypothetical protein